MVHRVEQLHEQREKQVELEDHDDEVHLGETQQQVVAQEHSHFVPRATDGDQREDEVDPCPGEIRNTELGVAPLPKDTGRPGMVDLGIGHYQSREKEERRAAEVQHGDEGCPDEVACHVGPDERVLTEDRETSDDPEEVQHLEVAMGPRWCQQPFASAGRGNRVGILLENVGGYHVEASLLGQLKCPSRRSVERMRKAGQFAGN